MHTANKLKVLIIEDNEGDLMLVTDYLSEVFPLANIIHCSYLSEAITVLKQQPIDIILLDLTLPDSKGEQSINQLKALPDTPPVIVLTGIADKETGINSLKLGVQDYLVKDDISSAILQKSILYSIERERIQVQMAQSEKRFRSLIENSTDGLALLNIEGDIIEMSSTASKIMGYPATEIMGINTPGFLHPEDVRKVVKLFAAVVNETNKVLASDFRILTPDGKYIWLETFFHNLLHDTAVNAIVLNFRDVTGRKKNEEEKKQLISELTKSNAELKQYTYITSHNLRAPLTNLISIINLIEWDKITDESTRLLLEAFKESTFQLNETLNDLIEAIIIKKSGNSKQTELLFSDMNEKVIRSLNSLIVQRRATITGDFLSAPTVHFDAVYLESIFTNLLSNALKYASPERNLEITIKSYIVEDGIELIFSDNGIGMDMTLIKERIFGLHQRFHNNTDSKGIGLYLVQSQMHAMGGSINVSSTINVGTTFTLNFKNQLAYA